MAFEQVIDRYHAHIVPTTNTTPTHRNVDFCRISDQGIAFNTRIKDFLM